MFMDEDGKRSINVEAQACDFCWTRKVKCDEGKSSYQSCLENHRPFSYQPIAPTKYYYAVGPLILGANILQARPCKPSNTRPTRYPAWQNVGLKEPVWCQA